MTAPVALLPSSLIPVLGATLMQLAGELEVLGSALCADPVLAEGHLAHLQKIDWCAQSLIQLALVIEAPDPLGAVERITLGDLRDRLNVGWESIAEPPRL